MDQSPVRSSETFTYEARVEDSFATSLNKLIGTIVGTVVGIVAGVCLCLCFVIVVIIVAVIGIAGCTGALTSAGGLAIARASKPHIVTAVMSPTATATAYV